MKWPNNGKFAVWLTHDVDRVKKEWFHLLYYFYKQKRFYHLISKFRKKEPYWNFETIMDIERKYNVKSTFFFLNESIKFNLLKPKEWKLALGRYNIHDKKIQEIIRRLDQEGWEIGVHSSCNSYRDKNLLQKEKTELENILGKKIYGVRQHYLNLDIPFTWKIQKEVGFKYDASFGFSRKVGFREGKYLPFSPFNDEFTVVPLAIMDSCLFENTKDIDEAWRKCLEMINLAETREGLLSILWHNRVFDKGEFPGYAEIYEKIIAACKKRGAWFGKGSDIMQHYSLLRGKE